MMQRVEELIQSEAGSLELVRSIKYPDGQFRCASCDGCRCYALSKRRELQCAECGKQTSLTAGTLFHGMRTPLHKLFRIIYDVCRGANKSCSAFARELQIPFSTVWRFLHKLRKIMDDSFPFNPGQFVHESVFGKILFKRSCESEASTGTDSFEEQSKEQDLAGAGSRELALQEVQYLQPVVTAILFISSLFQGISRKYLQLYLAEFCFTACHRGEISMLITACVRSGAVSDKQLAVYISPESVRLPAW